MTAEEEKNFKQVLVPAIKKAGTEILARMRNNDLRQKYELLLRKLNSYVKLLSEKVEQPNYLTMQLSNYITNVHLQSGIMFMSHLIREN